jgi:predicted N-acetyltransferase YhbS
MSHLPLESKESNQSLQTMIIRDAVISDAAEIARLTGELGYPANAEETAGRLSRVGDRQKQVVLVAVLEGKIAGWIQAQASEVLESGFRVEIVGLVVAESCRRCGVGRRLVEETERWASDVGAPAIVVRSNAKRVESHIFYPALGFSSSKTQAVYRKLLKKESNQAPEPTAPSRRGSP